MSHTFELAIVAIVKNEARYINEWLDVHCAEGVEHFFIYDNGSTDKLEETISSAYSDKVDIIPWKINPGQKTAYNDALVRYGDICKWMAFIDADEFLYARNAASTVKEVLRGLDHAAAVQVCWLLFGSSGHKTYIDAPVVKRFTKRAANVNPHTKAIVQPEHTALVGNNVHYFDVHGATVTESGKHLPYTFAGLVDNPTANILAINHYHTKSAEEYKEKCERRRADTGEKRDYAVSFAAHDCNDIEDLTLFKKTYVSEYAQMLEGTYE